MIDTLVDEIEYHPHREEILNLMYEQLADDTYLFYHRGTQPVQ